MIGSSIYDCPVYKLVLLYAPGNSDEEPNKYMHLYNDICFWTLSHFVSGVEIILRINIS